MRLLEKKNIYARRRKNVGNHIGDRKPLLKIFSKIPWLLNKNGKPVIMGLTRD